MNPLKRSTRTFLLIGLTVAASVAHAVKPLTETDLGDVSIDAQSLDNLLNVFGETAAGNENQVVNDANESNSLGHAAPHARKAEQSLYLTDIPSEESGTEIDKAILTPVKMNESRSEYGESLVISDPRLEKIKVQLHGNGLVIDVNKQIERVQTENISHGEGFATRGSQYMTNIQTQSSTLIAPR